VMWRWSEAQPNKLKINVGLRASLQRHMLQRS
jgi:hypothetical protein